MIQGLYQELVEKTAFLLSYQTMAGDMEATPQARHDAGVNADRLRHEIEALKTALQENELIVRSLGGVIRELTASKHKSRHRSLVITHLEQAQDRLRRELGDNSAA